MSLHLLHLQHIGTFEPNFFQISKSFTGFELHYSSNPMDSSSVQGSEKKEKFHKKFEFLGFMQLIFNQIYRDLPNARHYNPLLISNRSRV